MSDSSDCQFMDLSVGQFTGLFKCSHSDSVPLDVPLLAQWCQVNHQGAQLESSSFFGYPSSGPVHHLLSTFLTPDERSHYKGQVLFDCG